MSPKQILFLCTGNYYRSRFAEHLFNHLAAAQGLAWSADSCGLRVQADGVMNVGPLSRFTAEELARRNINTEIPLRFPRQVSAAELHGAHVIVALKEAEHRPLLQALHAEFVEQVRYWRVHDLDMAPPEAALAEIETLVNALIAELKAADAE